MTPNFPKVIIFHLSNILKEFQIETPFFIQKFRIKTKNHSVFS
jgi:hypothetical protein